MSLNNNNVITNASSARYTTDLDTMQSYLDLALQKVALRHQSSAKTKTGKITEKTANVSEVEGEVKWISSDLADLSGTIIFDEGEDTDTTFYTGCKLPVYGSQTQWYVNSQGKLVMETGGRIYGADTVPSESLANEPELTDGMIPVKYDTSSKNWVICSKTDEEWYNYDKQEKKWANVMLCDGKYDASAAVGTQVLESELGSMFVWIPRFAYKITSGFHDINGTMDVVFMQGNTYQGKKDDGSILTAKNGNDSGVITDAGYQDYVVHPAFTNGSKNGYSNGEWRSEIKGIWVAKFQAGFATTENDTTKKVSSVSNYYYPIFKGRKFAYNYVTASQCYNLSLAVSASGNPYGLTSKSNSHLMKNSEWGAVAYLSISEYGYSNGSGSSSNEKYRNNLSLATWDNIANSPVSNPNNSSWKISSITGYTSPSARTEQNIYSNYTDTDSLVDSITGTNGTSYAWNNVSSGTTGSGTKSSTTGNIYGIYDMGGCLADYTTSYVKGGSLSYGSAFANGTSTYLATAYPSYSGNGGIYDFNNDYLAFNKIFGDAIWELSKVTESREDGNPKTIRGWFNQYLEAGEDNTQEAFFPRGGNWSYTGLRACAVCMTVMACRLRIWLPHVLSGRVAL